jgi:SAM-dependent methyltransferase
MKKKVSHYNSEFFAEMTPGSVATASQVIPYILELVECKSAVDVGCGVGSWLSVFQKYGVGDVLGIDGAYVRTNNLLIPASCFLEADLTKQIQISRTFDIALSLEVAEHLPRDRSVSFVEFLTSLSSVVLFSASLPYQDGTNHINEQWLEYWTELFEKHGYQPIDCLRRVFWNNPQVNWWYAQNMVLYVKKEKLREYPTLEKLSITTPSPSSSIERHMVSHTHANSHCDQGQIVSSTKTFE